VCKALAGGAEVHVGAGGGLGGRGGVGWGGVGRKTAADTRKVVGSWRGQAFLRYSLGVLAFAARSVKDGCACHRTACTTPAARLPGPAHYLYLRKLLTLLV
jgi:hypothetical protein